MQSPRLLGLGATCSRNSSRGGVSPVFLGANHATLRDVHPSLSTRFTSTPSPLSSSVTTSFGPFRDARRRGVLPMTGVDTYPVCTKQRGGHHILVPNGKTPRRRGVLPSSLTRWTSIPCAPSDLVTVSVCPLRGAQWRGVIS